MRHKNTTKNRITVMGSFVADLGFRSAELPAWGQTILGLEFRLGPGGKGSNQAVAAARLGARVSFISKLGRDAFAELARKTYREEGIDTRFVAEDPMLPTGAASVVVHDSKGENAIVVVPGASFELQECEVDAAREVIAESAVFLAQLETRMPTVEHGLRLARELGVTTLLNPAPAQAVPERIYALCDYLTPNESEASTLTGIAVRDVESAEKAAEALLLRGAQNIVITLGENGALVKTAGITEHVPAFDAGPVIETTGAGDAFNGGFAVALSKGMDIVEATRFGCVVAGISVTRHGTAQSMPASNEVETLWGNRNI